MVSPELFSLALEVNAGPGCPLAMGIGRLPVLRDLLGAFTRNSLFLSVLSILSVTPCDLL